MHELAIAQALIETAGRYLPAGAAAVRSVHVLVGCATGVVPEALDLAFRAASAETRLAGAALIIEPVPGRSRCALCRCEFVFDGPLGACPRCGAFGGTLLAGGELELCSIEVTDV